MCNAIVNYCRIVKCRPCAICLKVLTIFVIVHNLDNIFERAISKLLIIALYLRAGAAVFHNNDLRIVVD